LAALFAAGLAAAFALAFEPALAFVFEAVVLEDVFLGIERLVWLLVFVDWAARAPEAGARLETWDLAVAEAAPRAFVAALAVLLFLAVALVR